MATLVSEIEKKKVIKKISSYFDFEHYCDYVLLESEVFIEKYKFYGFSFSNFLTIRFYEHQSIFCEISKFLLDDSYFLITITDKEIEFYKVEKTEISEFLLNNSIQDFIILETKMTWLLVYDKHRKLTGLGKYIQKKIKQNLNLRFGDLKLMFTSFGE